jgi:hypothetical protein
VFENNNGNSLPPNMISALENSFTNAHFLSPNAVSAMLTKNGWLKTGHIKMQNQKIGNCTWASSKGFALAAFYAVIRESYIAKIDSQATPAEKEKQLKSINEASEKIAKNLYKSFTKFSRIKQIYAYLEAHEASNLETKDNVLLEQMRAKKEGYRQKDPTDKEVGACLKKLDDILNPKPACSPQIASTPSQTPSRTRKDLFPEFSYKNRQTRAARTARALLLTFKRGLFEKNKKPNTSGSVVRPADEQPPSTPNL